MNFGAGGYVSEGVSGSIKEMMEEARYVISPKVLKGY